MSLAFRFSAKSFGSVVCLLFLDQSFSSAADLQANWATLTNKAQLSEQAKQYGQAASEFRAALAIAEKFEPNFDQVQLSLASLSDSLVRNHETSVAESYFLRSLAIASKNKGLRQNPDVGLALSDLSDAYVEEALTSTSEATSELCLTMRFVLKTSSLPPII